MKFTSRAYNNFDISPSAGVVTKSSFNKKLADEIEHYKLVPKELEVWFPRHFRSGIDNEGKHFIQLELYAYKNLGQFLLQDECFSTVYWEKVADLILSAISQFRDHEKPIELGPATHAMYIKKTMEGFALLKDSSEHFAALCSHENLVINGRTCLNFEELWDRNKGVWLGKLLKPVPCSFFHGDLCFSNILLGAECKDADYAMKLLDPRGKFGSIRGYGDFHYDLAKLMHSTDGGYEYFINGKYTFAEPTEGTYTINFSNNNKDRVHEIFMEKVYSKFDADKIKLIQGLIYIGMCAKHHYDDPVRQTAMYLTGVRILNEVAAQ